MAIAMSTVIMAVVTATLLYSSKVTQANLAQINAGLRCRSLYEHVAAQVRSSKHIEVAPDGLSVTLVRTDDSVCSYVFQDSDGNVDTILDNRIVYTSGDSSESIASGVSPGPGGWLFQPGVPNLLAMNFRIGDPSIAATHPSHAITGPGPQGVDVFTWMTPRNLHLWGG